VSKTSCASCTGSVGLSCVWYTQTNIGPPACVTGGLLGPDNTTVCPNAMTTEWYYLQCTISGSEFKTNFTYVVIIIICGLLLIFIILFMVYLCFRCYSEREDQIKSDKRKKKKQEQASKEEHKKRIDTIIKTNDLTSTDFKKPSDNDPTKTTEKSGDITKTTIIHDPKNTNQKSGDNSQIVLSDTDVELPQIKTVPDSQKTVTPDPDENTKNDKNFQVV